MNSWFPWLNWLYLRYPRYGRSLRRRGYETAHIVTGVSA